MRYIRLSKDNRVQEIIADNPKFPIETRFSAGFVSQLITIDDDTIELTRGMVYNKKTGEFSEYVKPTPQPTTEDRLKTLEEENENLVSKNKELTAQNQALSGQLDFLEECIVEMAEIIYS